MERKSFMPLPWNSVDFLQGFELPDDVFDTFDMLDQYIAEQEPQKMSMSSVEVRRAYSEKNAEVMVKVSGIAEPFYDSRIPVRPLSEEEVRDDCVEQAKTHGGFEGEHVIADGEKYREDKINVVFIPSRSNIYRDEGICVTAIGEFRYCYIKRRLPKWGKLYPMTLGQESMSVLEEGYFLVHKSYQPKNCGKVFEISYDDVPVVLRPAREGVDDLNIYVDMEKGKFYSVPQMKLTVGVVSEPNVVNLRVNGCRKCVQGSMGTGERYLFGIEKDKVYVLAMVYPNRSLVESEAMYMVSGSPIGIIRRGLGMRIRFDRGRFLLKDDGKGIAPLPIELPRIIPGYDGNTVGFINGTIRPLTDKELQIFIPGGVKYKDHFVPYKRGIVSRSRALLLPQLFRTRSFIGQYPRENLRLTHLFATGVHPDDVKSTHYTMAQKNRISSDISRQKFNGNNTISLSVENVEYSGSITDKIKQALHRYGSLFPLDLVEILREEKGVIMTAVVNAILDKEIYFSQAHGYMILTKDLGDEERMITAVIDNNVEYIKKIASSKVPITLKLHVGASLVTIMIFYERIEMIEMFMPIEDWIDQDDRWCDESVRQMLRTRAKCAQLLKIP